MKVRRLILVLAIALIVCGVGAKQGLAYMQETYGAPCTKLDGLPGLLQDMNLLATGDCVVKTDNSCMNAGNACSTKSPSGSKGSKIGTCVTATTTQGKKTTFSCSCVPN